MQLADSHMLKAKTAMSNQTPPKGEHQLRVLVVDDEIQITRTLEAILRGEGFDVATASSGEDAVLAAQGWHPDLVLSDVVMPGMDGVEAAIQISNSLPGCKIVLLSGYAVVYDLTKTARARGYEFDVIEKPIHPQNLIQHLRLVLGRG